MESSNTLIKVKEEPMDEDESKPPVQDSPFTTQVHQLENLIFDKTPVQMAKFDEVMIGINDIKTEEDTLGLEGPTNDPLVCVYYVYFVFKYL